MTQSPKTLILLFHPGLTPSKANAALAAAAANLPGVEVVNMYALYPAGAVDVEAEVSRLRSADRIVLQFPVQWYAPPPLLRAWQDAVLTRMFYIAYETEGRRLEGTPLLVAATAGNTPDAYGPDGVNLYPLAELLRPLEAMASRCGLPWAEPFLTYRASQLNDAQMAVAADAYAQRLRNWASAETQREAA
jgi:glutathione-regulated potassium-efflux system ancillary protein KefG